MYFCNWTFLRAYHFKYGIYTILHIRLLLHIYSVCVCSCLCWLWYYLCFCVCVCVWLCEFQTELLQRTTLKMYLDVSPLIAVWVFVLRVCLCLCVVCACLEMDECGWIKWDLHECVSICDCQIRMRYTKNRLTTFFISVIYSNCLVCATKKLKQVRARRRRRSGKNTQNKMKK